VTDVTTASPDQSARPEGRNIFWAYGAAVRTLSNGGLPLHVSRPYSMSGAGSRVYALRVTYIGELGWELHVPSPACGSNLRICWPMAGKEHGPNARLECKLLSSLRLEKA